MLLALTSIILFKLSHTMLLCGAVVNEASYASAGPGLNPSLGMGSPPSCHIGPVSRGNEFLPISGSRANVMEMRTEATHSCSACPTTP